ncbi:Tyrosinase [Arthrobotrys entomopaga]|nr:Tyrosinase [Arthrobotrys entomopaga]
MMLRKLFLRRYWDWVSADYQSHLPAITKKAQVDVVTPDGPKTIDNPLYSYKFKGTEAAVFKSTTFAKMTETTRGEYTFEGVMDNDYADKLMEAAFVGRRARLYEILMSETGYNDMSSALEQAHGEIHTAVGGGNKGSVMWWLYYSSFDPIFWLHHNNIDRMATLWQAANPGLHPKPANATATYQRIVSSASPLDDVTTPLYPFKHPDGSWWTPSDIDDATNIFKYGYGYPELPCKDVSTSSDNIDLSVTSSINTLYKQQVIAKKSRFMARAEAPDQQVIAWSVNIVMDQAELIGSFQVFVFIGPPPEKPRDWPIADNYVGGLTVLDADVVPVQGPSHMVTNTVAINPTLSKLNLLSLNQTQIDDYLAKNLNWKVKQGSVDVDISKLQTLKVGVTNNQMIIPSDNRKKATFGAPKLRTNATKSKIGGVSDADQLKKPKNKMGQAVTLDVGTIQNITVDNATNSSAAPPPAPSPVMATATASPVPSALTFRQFVKRLITGAHA